MRTVGRTLVEACGLLALAFLLGFSANGLRESGRIRPGKNYFDRGMSLELTPKSAPAAIPAFAATERTTAPASEVAQRHDGGRASVSSGKKLEHPFQEVTFEEVREIFEDPATLDGLNVFLDARAESTFEAGHIPRAIPCNPYEIENYVDRVLSSIGNADRIIVYCGGGDCEDSIFLCRELIGYDVPYNKLYLYEGGWKEWNQQNMPTRSGPAE